MKGIKAFTLAETLITLAIIGVVATLTIPNLIANYQRSQFEAAFKQGYSFLLHTTQLYLKENDSLYGTEKTSTWSRPLQNDFDKYTKTKKISNVPYGKNTYKTFNGKTSPVWNNGGTRYQLDSGATIQFDVWLYEATRLWYDVNGDKGPNRLGYDIFIFIVDDKKGVIPAGTPGYLSANNFACSTTGTGDRNGVACAYKAVKDKNYFKNLKF